MGTQYEEKDGLTYVGSVPTSDPDIDVTVYSEPGQVTANGQAYSVPHVHIFFTAKDDEALKPVREKLDGGEIKDAPSREMFLTSTRPVGDVMGLSLGMLVHSLREIDVKFHLTRLSEIVMSTLPPAEKWSDRAIPSATQPDSEHRAQTLPGH